MAELYWQDKAEIHGENPSSLPLYPPQTSHGLNSNRIWAYTVWSRRISAWDMARNFESKMNLNYSSTFSAYRAVNTLSHCYIHQSVHAV